jgi:hypothetical protein
VQSLDDQSATAWAWRLHSQPRMHVVPGRHLHGHATGSRPALHRRWFDVDPAPCRGGKPHHRCAARRLNPTKARGDLGLGRPARERHLRPAEVHARPGDDATASRRLQPKLGVRSRWTEGNGDWPSVLRLRLSDERGLVRRSPGDGRSRVAGLRHPDEDQHSRACGPDGCVVPRRVLNHRTARGVVESCSADDSGRCARRRRRRGRSSTALKNKEQAERHHDRERVGPQPHRTRCHSGRIPGSEQAHAGRPE